MATDPTSYPNTVDQAEMTANVTYSKQPQYMMSWADHTGDVANFAEAPLNNEPEGARVRRYETDGGVRLAGGRHGEGNTNNSDQDSMSEESTLPPPYQSYYK